MNHLGHGRGRYFKVIGLALFFIIKSTTYYIG